MEQFDKLNGTVVPSERQTAVSFILTTSGTPEQLEKTLKKVRKELALQGFIVSEFTAVTKKKKK